MSTGAGAVLLTLALGLALACTIVMTLAVRATRTLHSRSARLRGPNTTQISHLLGEQRSRIRHLVAVIGREDLYSALVEAEAERDRVLFSPEASEEMAQLSVNTEHMETVLAHPARRVRRPKASAIQLDRDFGSRTLRVLIADPLPGFGPPYVKLVAWTRPSCMGRVWRCERRGLSHAAGGRVEVETPPRRFSIY